MDTPTGNRWTVVAMRKDLDAKNAEIAALREAFEELAERVFDASLDSCDVQEIMQKHKLLVEVPSDEAFREEWGDDADTMLVVAWRARKLLEGE